MSNKIVVLGAGVSGLTTAYLLSKDPANKLTILAKYMPGDYDIEYASPWAGADYLPFGKEGSNQREWERASWPALREIAEKFPEAGLYFRNCLIYKRKKDQGPAARGEISKSVQSPPWFADLMPDFKVISSDQSAPEIDSVQSFTSICINTAIYLPWLVGQCVKNGVIFNRASFHHISEAANAHHSGQNADVIVNCTGLSSKFLNGVRDDNLYPDRGQIVIVRNDPGFIVSVSEAESGRNEVSYIIPRACGGGTIIGGSHHQHDWNPLPDPNLANRIMKRAIAICPQLVKKGQGIEGLDIVRHGVGLRPMRNGGPRVEKDQVEGVSVVHNYGHGGFGYQASFGCAVTAVSLVKEVLSKKTRAKL
ncbi:hypothetical protein N7478_009116 [Penicillium angulare]|uniref:uncharacterized protein n=1 Tax=Penicillium angulare TaxID=116970 RepID=UPI0025414123|nr:uncharacterized protein N7478_009116 [Penicillium angulare]KAJ5273991.1 hypothetical protein N7478_009116 [Penicillium angulare]